MELLFSRKLIYFESHAADLRQQLSIHGHGNAVLKTVVSLFFFLIFFFITMNYNEKCVKCERMSPKRWTLVATEQMWQMASNVLLNCNYCHCQRGETKKLFHNTHFKLFLGVCVCVPFSLLLSHTHTHLDTHKHRRHELYCLVLSRARVKENSH